MDGFMAPMGIEKRKMGGGDKDPAYVIKENMFMKITLGVVAALVILAITLCFTVLDVRVARHDTVKEHAHLRHEQHHAHRDHIKKDMKLQEVLQDEIEDLGMIADARTTMASLLQSYKKDIEATMSKHHEVHRITKHEMEAHHDRFASKAKAVLNKVFHEMQQERNKAAKLQAELSGDIQKEEHEDETEHEEYDKYMDEHGEHQGDGDGEEYHADDEAGDEEDDKSEHETDDPKAQLERFFKRWGEAKLLNLQEHTVGGWQKFWEVDVAPKQELEDADAAANAKTENEKKMHEMIGAAGIKPFNKEQHGEVYDYFEELLLAGKAMRHRAELDELMEHHSKKTKKEEEIIAALEKLGEKDVPLGWMFDDPSEKEPVFDQDEEYEKEDEAYQHEHEHDVDEEAAAAASAGSGSAAAADAHHA
jgi:hypothetical protein